MKKLLIIFLILFSNISYSNITENYKINIDEFGCNNSELRFSNNSNYGLHPHPFPSVDMYGNHTKIIIGTLPYGWYTKFVFYVNNMEEFKQAVNFSYNHTGVIIYFKNHINISGDYFK